MLNLIPIHDENPTFRTAWVTIALIAINLVVFLVEPVALSISGNPSSAADPSSTTTLVGASGAIAGVLGAYLVLYPRARVTSLVPFLFFFPARLPAWVVLGSWFVLQYFYAYGAGVAYLAHVVGFIAGIVLIIVLGGLSRRRRPPPTWQRWQTPYR